MNLLAETPTSQDLESLIRERTAGRVKNLKVSRRDDRLVLEGSSATFYAKQMAQHIARQLAPEGPLLNEIVVNTLSPRVA